MFVKLLAKLTHEGSTLWNLFEEGRFDVHHLGIILLYLGKDGRVLPIEDGGSLGRDYRREMCLTVKYFGD
jgi:hypothetical protein